MNRQQIITKIIYVTRKKNYAITIIYYFTGNVYYRTKKEKSISQLFFWRICHSVGGDIYSTYYSLYQYSAIKANHEKFQIT